MHNKKADVVIGMVKADSSAGPADLSPRIAAGMKTYFPQYSWTLVTASSGPPEKQTKPSVTSAGIPVSLKVPWADAHHVIYPWHGVPAKAKGYRAILEFARRAQATACLIVDPAQLGLESAWLDSLMRPGVHSKYDLVTPIYSGCAREQLLSGNLLSPLLRTLFGLGPKQPMSGEFLISARLVDRLLSRRDWDSNAARCTPELWISFIAAAEGYRIAESSVGPSLRQSNGQQLSTHAAIAQIAGSLFTLMEQYEYRWSTVRSAFDLDRFGQAAAINRESTSQNGLSYLVRFVEAFPALQDQWRSVLDPHTFAEIEAFQGSLKAGNTDQPLSDAVWVRSVYEIAAAWKRRVLPRDQILGLFAPILQARAGSFLMKTRWLEQAEVDAELSMLAGYYEALQPVLRKLWHGEQNDRTQEKPKSGHGVEAA